MTDQPLDRKLLVIRPWLSRSTIEPGIAYAHFEGIPMRAAEWPPYLYGAFDLLDQDELGAHRLRLHGFRLSCQIDNRHPDAYAWRWGYKPDDGGLFTPYDYRLYGPSISIVARKIAQLDAQSGRPASIGAFAIRLAQILRLDGVALLQTSPDGSFSQNYLVASRFAAADPLAAVRAIDDLTRELHETCSDRAHRRCA